jgi:hypothetical protein
MTEGPADTNESRWPDAADGGGLWWGCVGIKGKRKKEKQKNDRWNPLFCTTTIYIILKQQCYN